MFEWVAETPILKPIVITLGFTGLRPQELIVLTWAHVDLDKQVLSVKNVLNRVIEFDDEGKVVSRSAVIGKTKTVKSVRTIQLPDVVVNVLKEWQEYCKENNI